MLIKMVISHLIDEICCIKLINLITS